MAQIVKGYDRAAQLGQITGSALGNLLEGLAQHKTQQLAHRQQGAFWEQLGLAPEMAHALSSQPDAIQKEILSRLEGVSLGGQQNPLEALKSLGQPTEPQIQSQIQQQPSNLILGPGKQERMHRERLAQQRELSEKKMEAQEKREAFKLTKDERKQIFQEGKAARDDLHELDRLEELEKEGVDTPGYVEFLKRSGLDIPALMNPSSEEFQKVAQTFMRNAKNYLGSRISNFELEQFLKTIPSLSQSPEGRKRVIADLKYMARVKLEHMKALKKILKRNKNIPPLDLLEQIDDLVGNKMDKIAKKFKDDLAKPVPEGQNQLITASQALLGSVIGAPGKLLGGLGHLLGGIL